MLLDDDVIEQVGAGVAAVAAAAVAVAFDCCIVAQQRQIRIDREVELPRLSKQRIVVYLILLSLLSCFLHGGVFGMRHCCVVVFCGVFSLLYLCLYVTSCSDVSFCEYS